MFELVDIILKWLKRILLVSVLAALVSAIVSLGLADEFKSVAKVMPMNTTFLDKNAIFSDEPGRATYLFGGEADIDRLASLAESEELNQFLIGKYDLFNYYKVDPTKKDAAFKVRERLHKNFRTIKNPAGHLDIQVHDKDPMVASNMANDIAKQLDKFNKRILLEKKSLVRNLLRDKSSSSKRELDRLVDSLRNFNINSPKDTVFANILMEVIESKITETEDLRKNYEQTSSLVDADISPLYLIEAAQPAIKKDRPFRSLIVLGAFALAFFLMTLWAVFIEKYRSYNKVYG